MHFPEFCTVLGRLTLRGSQETLNLLPVSHKFQVSLETLYMQLASKVRTFLLGTIALNMVKSDPNSEYLVPELNSNTPVGVRINSTSLCKVRDT